MIVILAFTAPHKLGSRIPVAHYAYQAFERLKHFHAFCILKSAICNLKASQLALMNLDLHLIEKIAHLFHGNLVVDSDFLRQGAGYLPIFGGFLQLGGNVFFLQNRTLLPAPSLLFTEEERDDEWAYNTTFKKGWKRQKKRALFHRRPPFDAQDL
jgi:hypothetical protein